MAQTIGSLDLNAFSDLYSDSDQYFWFESDSTVTYGAGVHITLVPDTSFISNPTGQNILMNTDGFSIRNGLLPMMTLDNDSLDFNIVNTTAGTYKTTATFTATSAQIGQIDGAHSVIDASGQRFYATDGTTQLANIGYGEGNAESGTAIAPYYALGEFRTNYIPNYSSSSTYAEGDLCSYGGNTYVCKTAITTPEAWNANHWDESIGNYSTIEGTQLIASGDSSHAEGRYTGATGHYSHAEGGPMGAPVPGPKAIGECSHAEGGGNVIARGAGAHAEGIWTKANGSHSHAEGEYSIAQGDGSHAQNCETIANGENQTALGKYNVADTTSAVIIGNGTADDARSNALTIDWNGNVNIPPCGKVINAHLTNADSRETTPNLTPTGKRGITALLASSAMTTARPGEGTIIHCEWDNSGGWNSQLFIADNDTGNGKPFVAVRGQKSGTWTAWDRLLAQSDVTDYVIAQSQSTTSYGNGYWRWREWNSGKVEIWYHGSLTLTTNDGQSNGVYRYSRWFNFPNSYSLYRCTCIVNGMQEGGWYGCGGTRDSSNTVGAEPTRSFQVMGYRIQAQPPTTPSNLNIYICGQKTV